MGTPADRVPPGLLRHLHLIVNRKFAKQPRPNLEFVYQILTHAPELTQHQATVTWRFLTEPPPDGDSILVWQPPQMGTAFASDGYIWADVDTAFSQEYKGQTIEVFLHRSGLRPGKEPMATHSRRRYRLKQNPSLWLVCYHQADQRDFRPPQAINLTNETRRMLVERAQIEKNKSQLVRQEFMLHDTAKYPTVSIHSAASQASLAQQQGRYPGNAMAQMNRGQYNPQMQQLQQQQTQQQLQQQSQLQQPHPQQQQQQRLQQQQQQQQQQQRQQQQQQAMAARAAQAGLGPPPSKRPRHGPGAQAPVSRTSIPMGPIPMMPIPMGPIPMDPAMISGVRQGELLEEVAEENENIASDFMDFLTPRDIALDRYVRHHEWLEEVISSPYDTHRIVPPVLGLGRKGELESLTADFFDAPEYEETIGRNLPDPEEVNLKKVRGGEPVIQEFPIARVGRLEGSKAADFTKRATERVAAINAEMESLRLQHANRMKRLSKGIAFREAEQKVRRITLDFIHGEADETSPVQVKEFEDLQTSLLQQDGKRIRSVLTVECTEKGGREEPEQKPVEEPQEPQDLEMTGLDTFDLDGPQLPTPSEPTTHHDAAEVQSASGDEPMPPVEAPAVEVPAEAGLEPPQILQRAESQSSLQQSATPEIATEDYVMVSKEDIPAPVAHEPANPAGSSEHATGLVQGASGGELPDLVDTQPDDFAPLDFGGDSIDFGDMNTAGDELSNYAQDIVNMSGGASDHSNLGLISPPAASPLPDIVEHSEPQHQQDPS